MIEGIFSDDSTSVTTFKCHQGATNLDKKKKWWQKQTCQWWPCPGGWRLPRWAGGRSGRPANKFLSDFADQDITLDVLQTEVEFVHAVSAGDSVKFLPAE